MACSSESEGQETVLVECVVCGEFYLELANILLWMCVHPTRRPTCILCDKLAEESSCSGLTEKGRSECLRPRRGCG